MSLDFPADVLADADDSVRKPRLPDEDETAIPFLTIDPPESMDLDQALHIERDGGGYRVRYAIADVAAFATPTGRWTAEAHARGQTLYAPDRNAPSIRRRSPRARAASSRTRRGPRSLWTMDVDETGEGIEVDVRRALVRAGRSSTTRACSARSRTAPRRDAPAAARGRPAPPGARGAPRRDQPAHPGAGGGPGTEHGYELSFRAPLPVEGWNAQISLMTGQAAAELMLQARLGVRGRCPRPIQAVARLKLTGKALGSLAEAGDHRRVHPTLDPRARPRRACSPSPPSCCAAPATPLSTTRCRHSPPTPGSAPRTRIRPRRCGGSSTATSARSASPSRRARRSPSGRTVRSRSGDDGALESAGAAIRGRDHLDRRGCPARRAGRRRLPTPSWSTSTARTAAGRSS